MRLANSKTHWGAISKTLHWLIALLMLLAIALGITAEDMALSPEKIRIFIYHKSIGITVLGLALLRFAWILTTTKPEPPSTLSPRNIQLAQLGHWFLYSLMFALPLSGWLINSAANIPFKWMNIIAVPALPGTDKSWQEPSTVIHQVLFLVLLAAVLGHAAMALLHHYRHRSNLLVRMWPKVTILRGTTFSVIIIASVYWLFFAGSSNSENNLAATTTVTDEQLTTTVITHTDQQWQIIPEQSRLAFIGSYDGVEFNGEFQQFSAQLFFDPANPAQAYFDVEVNTSSITTYTEDWDASLADLEWFNSVTSPLANYKTTHIQATDEGYSAEAILSLKGVNQSIPLYFQWQPREDSNVDFTAEATLNRRDFGIGSGMWANDPTIGFEVKVKVILLLSKIEKP
jgi:cytochrome b561/polyisoprenoid-binding protein YceI